MRKFEKYGAARQAIDDNTEQALCMLYNNGYKKKSEYVILLFHGKMVMRTRLIVTLYVHWLCCVILKHVTHVIVSVTEGIFKVN